MFVDVGGDVLGAGHEPGLASPLCDAVMLAAGALLQRRGATVLGAVFGPGCDGELTLEELLGRLALLAGAGALLRDRGPHARRGGPGRARGGGDPDRGQRPGRAVCARRVGNRDIRGGRRTVQLTPFGAATVYFDPQGALESAAPLARELLDAPDLAAAQERLHALGVRTELDYERAAGDQ